MAKVPFSLGLASKEGGYSEPDYYVWCGSVIEGDDGLFHMFASRWSRDLPFNCWCTHSEIVRAVSKTPVGPFKFVETALGRTDDDRWDAHSLHNPNIHKTPDGYALFYSGTRFDGDYPAAAEPQVGHSEQWLDAWNHQRIGVATSISLEGPWTRCDQPILEPRPNRWDAVITSNPATVVHSNGSVVMVYKSIAKPYEGEKLPAPFKLGIAMAPSVLGPYSYCSNDPLFQGTEKSDLEDPFIWRQDGIYHMLIKDMNGVLAGEPRSGIYAQSRDGLTWEVAEHPKCYSLDVAWDDGSKSTQPFLERAHVLLREGKPSHIYFATAPEVSTYAQLKESRNVVIPLKV